MRYDLVLEEVISGLVRLDAMADSLGYKHADQLRFRWAVGF